jgi:hypothetical protein
VLRIQGDAVATHTGKPVEVRTTLVDEQGRLYAATDAGLGVVHTLDMHVAADLIDAGRWTPEEARADDLPARFGFVRSPAAGAAKEKAGR